MFTLPSSQVPPVHAPLRPGAQEHLTHNMHAHASSLPAPSPAACELGSCRVSASSHPLQTQSHPLSDSYEDTAHKLECADQRQQCKCPPSSEHASRHFLALPGCLCLVTQSACQDLRDERSHRLCIALQDFLVLNADTKGGH